MAAPKLERELKTALDETRLLILGAQILLGFQFNAVFQELFADWTDLERNLHALALLLMVIATALLIAPSMRHRITERGACSGTIVSAAGAFASAALLPFALSLGIDHFTVFSHLFGINAGRIAGAVFFIAAVSFWFALAYALRRPAPEKPAMNDNRDEPTPLFDRVDHMLTEARVVLPGAQALLGFQLSVVLLDAFLELPALHRIVHAAALGCVALSVILLMAPAALHRIAFRGEETEDLHRIGSRFVIAATIPLAAGIAADVFVATAVATQSNRTGLLFAGATSLVVLFFWYVQPLMLRARRR